MHPLAVEDLLHKRNQLGRSKADYYLKHLFIRILRHALAPEDEEGGPFDTVAPTYADVRSNSPVDMSNEDLSDDDEKTVHGNGSKFSTRKGSRHNVNPEDIELGPLEKQTRTSTTESVKRVSTVLHFTSKLRITYLNRAARLLRMLLLSNSLRKDASMCIQSLCFCSFIAMVGFAFLHMQVNIHA